MILFPEIKAHGRFSGEGREVRASDGREKHRVTLIKYYQGSWGSVSSEDQHPPQHSK